MKEVNGYNPSKDPHLINCKTECGNERCFAKRYGLFAEKTCQNFTEPKLQTNADRIRGMTDEELAEYIDLHTAEAMWCNAPPDDCPPHETCELCILDWLKSPVEEEERQ